VDGKLSRKLYFFTYEVDRIHLKAAKLRLDAVIEERERLAMDTQGERTRALMIKLDKDIDEMTQQIVNMHQSLELKGDALLGPTGNHEL
jgi:hypothetical protein